MTADDRRRRLAARSRRRKVAETMGEQMSFALDLFPERDRGHVVLDSGDMERIRKAIAQEPDTSRRAGS